MIWLVSWTFPITPSRKGTDLWGQGSDWGGQQHLDCHPICNST